MRDPGPALIDELDRRVIAALQLNGRAPWSAIAKWAGANESTVQRRFTSLTERGLVRVVGTVDLNRTDAGSSMLVRIHAVAGKGRELAEVLAARPEARFLAIVTGTADLIVDFVAENNEALLRILFTELPGAELIASTENIAVLRTFTTAPLWDTGILPGSAVAELRQDTKPPYARKDWDEPPKALSQLERAVVDKLTTDGRIPIAVLARALGRSESAVARALERLTTRGNLRFRTLVEPEILGYELEFMLWLSVAPGHWEQAGRYLAKHPATKFLAASTGRFNLVGQMVLERRADLLRYMNDVVGELPGLTASDVTLHLATLKRAWIRVDRFR